MTVQFSGHYVLKSNDYQPEEALERRQAALKVKQAIADLPDDVYVTQYNESCSSQTGGDVIYISRGPLEEGKAGRRFAPNLLGQATRTPTQHKWKPIAKKWVVKKEGEALDDFMRRALERATQYAKATDPL